MSNVVFVGEDFLEELFFEEENGDYALVESSDWEVDYKYQRRDVIVVHRPTGKYFMYSVTRSGSDYTDWYYQFDDNLTEVEKKEVVIKTTEWVVNDVSETT